MPVLVHRKDHACLYYAQLMPNMPNVPVLCLPDAQNACTIPVFPKLHAAAPSVLTILALCQAL